MPTCEHCPSKLEPQELRLSPEAESAEQDELQLLAYTPQGVHLFRHDLHAGVSTKQLASPPLLLLRACARAGVLKRLCLWVCASAEEV